MTPASRAVRLVASAFVVGLLFLILHPFGPPPGGEISGAPWFAESWRIWEAGAGASGARRVTSLGAWADALASTDSGLVAGCD